MKNLAPPSNFRQSQLHGLLLELFFFFPSFLESVCALVRPFITSEQFAALEASTCLSRLLIYPHVQTSRDPCISHDRSSSTQGLQGCRRAITLKDSQDRKGHASLGSNITQTFTHTWPAEAHSGVTTIVQTRLRPEGRRRSLSLSLSLGLVLCPPQDVHRPDEPEEPAKLIDPVQSSKYPIMCRLKGWPTGQTSPRPPAIASSRRCQASQITVQIGTLQGGEHCAKPSAFALESDACVLRCLPQQRQKVDQGSLKEGNH